MVLITATAQMQTEALERHCSALGRDAAIVRMTEAVAMAARTEEQAGPFRSAPQPYPDPVDLGFRWLKDGRCRIAVTPTPGGYAVTGLFETAAIPRRT